MGDLEIVPDPELSRQLADAIVDASGGTFREVQDGRSYVVAGTHDAADFEAQLLRFDNNGSALNLRMRRSEARSGAYEGNNGFDGVPSYLDIHVGRADALRLNHKGLATPGHIAAYQAMQRTIIDGLRVRIGAASQSSQ